MAISLARVTARDTLVHWFEAVAIVQGLCDALASSGTANPAKLDLSDVFIDATGHVTATSGNALDPATVSHVGTILGTLCGSEQTPVQLRLLIAEATSPSAVFPSVQALSEQVAYYERPGRADLVRSVYERWEAAPEVTETAVPSLTEMQTALKSGQKKRTKRLPFVAAAAAAAAVTLVAAWRLQGAATADSGNVAAGTSTRVMNAASQATSALAEGIRTGATAIRQKLGLDSEAKESSGEAVAAAPKQAVEARRLPRREKRTEGISLRAFDVAVPANASARANGADPANVIDSGVIVEPAHATAAARSEDLEPDDELYDVYDSSHEDVMAPYAIRPQLPRALPPGMSSEDLAQVELVISPEGDVESVRLLSMPQRSIDVMLLSAAKTWRFAPARRKNVPVRYRYRLLITAP